MDPILYPRVSRLLPSAPCFSLRPRDYSCKFYYVPVTLLCILIPTSFVLFYIFKLQSDSGFSMYHGIGVEPTLAFSVDSMCIGVVLISIFGFSGVAKGSKRMMRLYFAFVVVFVTVQGLLAVKEFMASKGWAYNALDLSWSVAYESDSELIMDLQTEFNCQGFNDRTDRALELPFVSEDHLPACSAVLVTSFGEKLQRLGSIVLCIRLLQLGGVLLLSLLFKYLASMEREEYDQDELEDLSFSEEKTGYCLREKQLEEASARVPLLLTEDVDDDVLPHYYIRNAYVDNDGSRSGDNGDDSEEDDGHSDCRLQGYQSLSDDPYEQEFSVYVA